jgi:hypothetical protein
MTVPSVSKLHVSRKAGGALESARQGDAIGASCAVDFEVKADDVASVRDSVAPLQPSDTSKGRHEKVVATDLLGRMNFMRFLRI